MLEDRYFETEYKNNPEQLYRQRIITNLDPFRHLSNGDVTKLYERNSVSFEDFMIKVNFSSMITRFERENTNLIQFGNNLEFDVKINRIKEELKRYASEMKPEPVSINTETITTQQPQ